MSVVSVTEDFSRRSADQDMTADKATRVFIVLTDDWDDGPVIAKKAIGIPRLGEEHPQNRFLRCIHVGEARAIDDMPTLFEVPCEYSSQSTAGFVDNPLLRPKVVFWRLVKTQEPVEECTYIDIEDNEYPHLSPRNSAGIPFTTNILRDVTRPALFITRNEETYDINQALLYADAVNSVEFYGAAKGKVKCQGIVAEPRQEASLNFFETTYEFHFREDGWIVRILDTGRQTAVIDQPSNTIVDHKVIVDKDGIPVGDPVYLDGRGGKNPPNTDPKIIRFRIYERELSFAPLRLE